MIRGILLFISLFLFALNSLAEGTKVSGQINKEILSFSDDGEKAGYLGIKGVNGSESRVKFSGDGELTNSKYAYFLSIGMNTNKTDGSDNIRVRQAWGKFEFNWGAFKIGQAFSPATLRFIALDPFSNTSAQSFRLDLGSYLTGYTNIVDEYGLGYHFKGFSDQVTYYTPVFANVQFAITYDNMNKSTTFDKANDKQSMEYLVTYDNKWDSIGINTSISYYNEMHGIEADPTATPPVSDFKRNGWTIANNLDISDFSVDLAYGVQNVDDTDSDADEVKRMLLGFSYKLNSMKFAVSYGEISRDKNKDTQIALGAFYNYSEMLSTHLVLAQYKIKREGTNVVETSDENNGQAIILGTTIKF